MILAVDLVHQAQNAVETLINKGIVSDWLPLGALMTDSSLRMMSIFKQSLLHLVRRSKV